MSQVETNTILRRGVAILWQTVAIAVVFVAVLLSAMRLALPHIDKVNHNITEFLSQQLNAQVKIQEITGDWRQGGPSLSLAQLSVVDDAQNTLSVEQLNIGIDVISSLQQMSLVTHDFDLSSAELILKKFKTAPNANNEDVSALVPLLEKVFIEQLTYFSIDDLNISLLTENYNQTYNITELTWLNRNKQHTGLGKINVSGQQVASLSVALSGGVNNLSGQIYFAADDVPIANLLPAKLAQYIDESSNFSTDAWVMIDDNAVTKIIGAVPPNALKLSYNQENLAVKNDAFTWSLTPETTTWQFSLPNAVISVNESKATLALNGRIYPDGQTELSLEQPLALGFTNKIWEFLRPEDASLDISGALSAASFHWFSNTIQLGHLTLQDLALSSSKYIGVDAINVDLNWHKIDEITDFHIDVRGNNGTILSRDVLLADDLVFYELAADAYVQRHPAGTKLLASSLALDADIVDISLKADFTDILNLTADLVPETVANIIPLLPTQLMGKQTYAYLVRALNTATQSGKVEQATVTWQGLPQDFPFTDGNGFFNAQVAIKDADFLFDSRWPVLEELDLVLNFVNDDLFMEAPKARLGNVTVSDMKASIPGLNGRSILTIDASGEGTGFAVSQVMANSSLADSLGKVLSDNIIISNGLSATLNLEIPLTGRNVKANGDVQLTDNYVLIKNIDTELTKTSGTISFANDNVTSTDLTAHLLGQPVDIAFALSPTAEAYEADIQVTGDFDSEPLVVNLNQDLADLTDGIISWQADIDLNFPFNAPFSYAVDLNATLTDTELNLPLPFATAQQLQLAVTGDAKFTQVEASLDDNVSFTGTLPHAEMQFSRAHLRLGEELPLANMGTGFSIAANLPQVDIFDWYRFVEVIISASDNEQKNGLFAAPERIFINADSALIAGQQLNAVNATVKQADDNWQISLTSNETRATANLYNDWLGNGIDINANYINLTQWASSENAMDVSWELLDLPPIRFNCGQCSILGNNFGQITMNTVPNEQGIAISEFRIKNSEGELSASGQWDFNTSDTHANTFLDGSLRTEDFGQFLQRFNFDSGIVDSSAEFTFALNWQDTPMDFNFKNLDGEVDWALTDGYLTEISDKGSRIFTLVSLESLVRKLSLDFRDVFAQGFFYDEMRGTIAIEQGIASTQDTVVDGGAGEIEITGFTDLSAQELNYNVSFTPDVTGNLPALMYFMVNPPTAIAALAVNQVLTEAKVFSNINYSITGTFADPVIAELGRTSADVSIPTRVTGELPIDPVQPISELDKQGLPILQPLPDNTETNNGR